MANAKPGAASASRGRSSGVRYKSKGCRAKGRGATGIKGKNADREIGVPRKGNGARFSWLGRRASRYLAGTAWIWLRSPQVAVSPGKTSSRLPIAGPGGRYRGESGVRVANKKESFRNF
jgi:hypothetical protein